MDAYLKWEYGIKRWLYVEHWYGWALSGTCLAIWLGFWGFALYLRWKERH